MEVNEFIFLSTKEFQGLYGSNSLFPQIRHIQQPQPKPITPKSFFVVFSIPNPLINHYCYSGSPIHQGLCGACYAIAAADLVAITLGRKKYNYYEELSAQQIVSEWVHGCSGASLSKTLNYTWQVGLHPAYAYPYRNRYSYHAKPAMDGMDNSNK